jgi:glycosyltransferase involved in cell wall biosynthesis
VRILIVTTDTRTGGTPTRMAAIARGARARGHEVMLISVLPMGAVSESLAADGIPIDDLGVSSSALALRGVRKLRRIIGAWRPDVIQASLWHGNLVALLAARGTGVPVIAGHQSVDDDKPRFRVAIDRRILRRAAAHVCVSEKVGARMIVRDRVPREKVVTIPIGKNLDDFTGLDRRESRLMWNLPENAKVVGWLGRHDPVKDLPTLMRAVGVLEDWWLLVGGAGPGGADVERATWTVGIDERTRVFTDVTEVPRFMAALDVFALPSLQEGSPGALVEAMASGLPVVATPVGGVPEIVSDGVNGLLVPVRDPSALAHAIERAAADVTLGERARETVREWFSEEFMIASHEKLWREVAAKHA